MGGAVIPARRAGAPRLIEWTGERCVPWAPDIQVVYEHLHRYLWAARLVDGRRVLDLGSGEGFGSAILADRSSAVVGIDIDELTVEHSRLNYGAPNLEFSVGTALDLTKFEAGSFGAVVAFEVIEHVREQEQVLGEIARLLGDDGIVIISTPDRPVYDAANAQPNPFHQRELTLDEFTRLLATEFPNVASWGQRTITGSHLSQLKAAGQSSGEQERTATAQVTPNFYVARAGEEWQILGEPAALYCVAVASKAPLPALAHSSTLADCDLQLLRKWEGEAGRERASHAEAARQLDQARDQLELFQQELEKSSQAWADRNQSEGARAERAERELEARIEQAVDSRERLLALRAEEVASLHGRVGGLRQHLAAVDADLADARQLNRITTESVTWQAFQRARGRLYGRLGERSLPARMLGMSLRLAGRVMLKRPQAPQPQPQVDDSVDAEDLLTLPVFESPTVSLIIPVYAHAELTRACLRSIRDLTTEAPYEVIIIDDTADEDTKALLASVRGARIIHNERNLGYLRSMNLAAATAKGRWLILFNNDTEVTKGWLAAMLDCGESSDEVGVVTPKYVYPDGRLNEAGGVIWRDGTGMNYGRGDAPDLFQYEYRRETDYGSAAALMVRADFWNEVGGFDERFLPMFYEDTDLCFQARERNLRVMYEPGAVVVHIEGATTGGDLTSGHKRHQEENRPKFVAKWRHQLESEALRPSPVNARAAANRHRGPHVLVIDHHVPTWDQDSGSLRMFEMLRALVGLGAKVTFMPDNLAPMAPYTRRLQSLGVEVMYGSLDVNAELATIGPNLAMAILSRPHPAARWLDKVREFAPSATIVYDTVDLHWLREARRSIADIGQTRSAEGELADVDVDALPAKARALRYLELAMVGAADATIVVSESERAQLQRDAPSANIVTIPNIHPPARYVLPPEDRIGILFVGSFRHPPNVGAALRLAREVMPAVRRELRDARLTIVGADAPPEVQALASPVVDVAGWVEDLQPLLDQSSVLVAPLSYGAGLKGKVTQCLAAGLPVVTTPVGAEGIDGLSDCVLVAQDTEEMAAQVVRVMRDAELWRELSQAGQALIASHCSPEVVAERLGELLEGITPSQRLTWRAGSGAG
jgi:O-antigen biosynthesis protein